MQPGDFLLFVLNFLLAEVLNHHNASGVLVSIRLLAVIGLCINGAVCGYSAAAAYRIYNDPAAMQQFREQLKDNYGIDADELFYDPWAESSGGTL